ncbi:MAG: c-type cytochrome [Verrucomicrobiales bacterium]|nr:c-type cytochrome [Verrucomicrobiales bacterium]
MLIRLLIGVIGCSACFPLAAADFPEPYNTEEAAAPPMSAEEVVKTAKLPEGFHLEVFASEPQVQQPISIAFDEQDRLWVAECYTFAERPRRWDLELSDRILVLEDEDGDGKADKRTVFWDEGKRMTSAIPGHGGVWALCAPQLLFIPDADNDLVPDGDPVVVLDGFDAEKIGHNIANGLKWGPDGWLYGRHGIVETSWVGASGSPKSQRTPLNTSIWRYDPIGKKFEVFCHGGTNPWGLDWDRNGQLFYTNTVIGHLWHGIPGAYYTRMFGTHLNRHAYELIPHTADHYHWDNGSEKWSDIREGITDTTSALGGGHAHMGCLIYEGGVWPEEYHGDLFACNLHGRRVNRDHLEKEGVGYVAHHGEDFLMIEDPWFRGLDLITGPDGQVWMNDWSDTGECHDNDAIHRTSGRIYRIVYDGPDKGTPAPNRPQWLTSRADPDFGMKDIEALLNSGDEAKVAMGVRWLGEDAGGEEGTLATLLKIAEDSPAPLVRLELAASLQLLSGKDRFALAEVLSQEAQDAGDRQQSLMIWYGVEAVVPEFSALAVALAAKSKLPDVTRLVTRRLVEDLEAAPGPVNELLSQALSSEKQIQLSILSGVESALEGWGKAPQPAAWKSFSEALAALPEAAESVQGLAVLFGDGRARDELFAMVNDEEADPVARRSALGSLLRQPDEALLALLKKLVNDRVVGLEVVRGFAAYDDPDVPKLVMGHWQRFPLHRGAAADTMVSRPSYASALLSAVEKKYIPRDAITPFQARQIVSLNNTSLTERLKKAWGEVRETPAEKKEEIRSWKSLLTSDVIGAADAKQGKIIFSQTCGACHRLYGEGGAIGPDLTGSDRHSIDYLLDNTVNPNDVVPADYMLTVFTMKDGRVVSGVVPEENEKTVSVQSAAEMISLSVDEIEKRETMPVSLMPEGLLKALGEDAVKDLVAYLMTRGPISDE